MRHQSSPADAPCRMNRSTFDAISTVLVDKFHVEAGKVRPDATLEQLGLDSLALMEFVFAVEDRFDVRIPEDRLDPRQAGVTLEHLAGLLDEAVAARPVKDGATP
jgi:acyl carrier protein